MSDELVFGDRTGVGTMRVERASDWARFVVDVNGEGDESAIDLSAADAAQLVQWLAARIGSVWVA